ncbi:MAG: hypothetical protein GWN47_09645 [Woeseiaceae bacterium]|nr:hypothetical protein [Woeseiaceae bacterium]
MTQQDNADRTVGLVRALAWPTIALIGIVLFTGPVKGLIRAGNLESVKIGSLELNLRAGDLPQVTDRELARALTGLPEAAIIQLLATEPGRPVQVCQMGTDQGEFNEKTRRPLNDLSARKLLEIEEVQFEGGDVCLTPLLTDLGIRARTFIIDLMTAQLRTATVQ